ncbi:MAG TPA: MOSC domain-containing protein [Saprospiraceae bacterium]|nr:MOSC domain-containing protein [Saprospiraceae bacterium]
MSGFYHSLNSFTIYPLKSASGIHLKSAKAGAEGFFLDRRWILIDPVGKFVSQRVAPRLALITQTLQKEKPFVSLGSETRELPELNDSHPSIIVSIWGDVVEAVLAGDFWDSWFSRFLDKPVRLAYMKAKGDRIKIFDISPGYAPVSFADGYPYLILGTASVDALNQRLNQPIPVNRFRPNIVINTAEPHEEDKWDRFRIGNVIFKCVKLCPRCVVTTIDQKTALRSAEPLKTLASYRKNGNEIYFAVNAIVENEGMVHLEDEIEILSWK